MDTEINYDQVMSELYMTDTSKVMVELIKWVTQIVPDRVDNYLLKSYLEFEDEARTTIKFTITATDFKGTVITQGRADSLLPAKDMYGKYHPEMGLYELVRCQTRMIGNIREMLLCVIQEIIASGESDSSEAQAD